MSVLRMLSPARAVSPHPSSSKSREVVPILTLHVPAYGALFMNPPEERSPSGIIRSGENDQPRIDEVVNGELEITLPVGSGKRRCKSIRVGMRSTIQSDLGPTRMNERDVIFERKVEIIGGTSEGIWLDEGTQRFEFTLILPSDLAPHDCHVNGRIWHDLYAEIEGVADSTTPSTSGGLFSFRSKQSSSRTRSRDRSPRTKHRAYSPAYPVPSGSNAAPAPQEITTALTAAAASLSITRQEPAIPQTPSYAQSEAEANGETLDDSNGWLKGFHEIKRAIMIFYNPNPSGGVNELAERQTGFAEGLGAYELELMSDVFSICALLRATLALSSLSPATTVFSFNVQLSQTYTLVSPRDDPATIKPLSSTRFFNIIECGKRPPKAHQHPDKNIPALWRGPLAGGKDLDELKIEITGRLPDDDSARPSTLPNVVTPIRVSHALVAEVFFSVWGETDTGEPMRAPGPGGLRLLRISRPLVLPSCAFIPQNLNLPTYDDHAEFKAPRLFNAEHDTLCPRHGCPLISIKSNPEWIDFFNKNGGLGPAPNPYYDGPTPTVNPISPIWLARFAENGINPYVSIPGPSSSTGTGSTTSFQSLLKGRSGGSGKQSSGDMPSSPGMIDESSLVCPLCFFYHGMPKGPFGRGTCACGVGIEQMEERMKRFANQERDQRARSEEEAGRGNMDKVLAERERGRGRERLN